MATADLGLETTGGRDVRRAALYLLGLGAFFYASYGLTNWLASLRTDVPSIVFAWEAQVPFLGWTILPYWTTNLFYAGSLFLAANRRELEIHARRLLATQIIAVICFLALPLKFSWGKPDTSGAFGFLFDSLGAFDKPFNQAPSLHVALTVVLGSLYLRHLPRWMIAPFLIWSALVIASTMTTFQHHFIDLPTGALLGLLVVRFLPFDGVETWRPEVKNLAPHRKTIGTRYLKGGLILALLALIGGGAFLWFLWPAVALLLVSLAYLKLGAKLLGKEATGSMDPAARILLAPYLLAAFVNSRLWTRHHPAPVEIADGVFVGRFPSANDTKPFATVIDLTAEFSRPNSEATWHAFPTLDLVAPSPALLMEAAEAIETARTHGPVLVCCALGYGRSIAAATVWLVRSGRAQSVGEALQRLKSTRPQLVLSEDQRAAIEVAIHD